MNKVNIFLTIAAVLFIIASSISQPKQFYLFPFLALIYAVVAVLLTKRVHNKQTEIKTVTAKRSVILDFLRVLAVSALVLSHIAIWSGLPLQGGLFGKRNIQYTDFGNGVSLFIILSGLVLELKYANKKIIYWDFIKKRLLRIYSVYFLCLSAGVIIYFFFQYFSYKSLACTTCSFYAIACSIAGFCAFIGLWGGPFLYTGWFIGVIIVLYILYPFLSKLIRIHPFRMIAILFLISSVSRYFMLGDKIFPLWSHRWFPLTRIGEFGLGIFLADVIPQGWWYIYNNKNIFTRINYFFSQVSFPLFLIHYPLIPLMPYLFYQWHLNYRIVIFIYLAISLILSTLIFKLNAYLLRHYFKSLNKKL